MPKVVMRYAIRTDILTGSIKSFLAFAYTEYFCVEWFAFPFTAHSLKESASVWNQRYAAHFPILRTRLGVAAHNNLTNGKINVAPFQGIRFAQATSCERQTCREVSAVA
jgi:hypothetical protein